MPNSKVFLLICHEEHVGGLPIGLFLCSSEKSVLIKRGLELIVELVGDGAFYGTGFPTVVMTDDSKAEKNALATLWPQTHQVLCIFHSLQEYDRWLLANMLSKL